jgi:GMP synthase (glutamine-hydrolysing)
VTIVVDLCDRDLSWSEYVRPIAVIAGEAATVMRYSDVTEEDVEAEDAVVICGTALLDDVYLDHLDAFDWLRHTSTPVLGVCAGMQVIALLHGARLVPGKEIGMTPIEPVDDNPLVPAPEQVYCLHRHDLGGLDEFRVLARSECCVQAIAHRTRPLHGVAFHPEVRRENVVSRFLSL